LRSLIIRIVNYFIFFDDVQTQKSRNRPKLKINKLRMGKWITCAQNVNFGNHSKIIQANVIVKLLYHIFLKSKRRLYIK